MQDTFLESMMCTAIDRPSLYESLCGMNHPKQPIKTKEKEKEISHLLFLFFLLAVEPCLGKLGCNSVHCSCLGTKWGFGIRGLHWRDYHSSPSSSGAFLSCLKPHCSSMGPSHDRIEQCFTRTKNPFPSSCLISSQPRAHTLSKPRPSPRPNNNLCVFGFSFLPSYFLLFRLSWFKSPILWFVPWLPPPPPPHCFLFLTVVLLLFFPPFSPFNFWGSHPSPPTPLPLTAAGSLTVICMRCSGTCVLR